MTILEITLIVVVAGLILVTILLVQRGERQQKLQTTERSELQRELSELRVQAAQSQAALEADREQQERQQEQFDRQLSIMTERFETLSERITKERAEELSAGNQKELDLVLRPLKESLEKMDRALKESGESSSARAGRLDAQITQLMAQTVSVGSKADRLAEAMSTHGKTQGDWGETQLLDLLQLEGFHPGVEYDEQVEYRRNGTAYRPDCVLHFPDGREVMVDAKVSINAYLRYWDATEDDRREMELKAIEADLDKHLRELTTKKYHTLPVKEDKVVFPYTLMFVPNPNVLSILPKTSDLHRRALEGHVFIVTPESLMLFLKIIDEAWSGYRQEKNIEQVVELARKLVNQADNIVRDFTIVGQKIEDAHKSFDATMTHLSGKQGLLGYTRKISERIK